VKHKKVFLLMTVALLGIGFFVWKKYQRKNEESIYQSVQVARGDLEVSVLATGVVQPENRLELKPPIAGRVETLEVDEGQWVKKGQVLAWLSSSDRAALLDAARAKGPQELAHWEEFFKPTPLLAPLDGLIIVKAVVPGQVVAASEVVLVMSDHLLVNTQVDETDIAQVKLGQGANITLDAYPREEISGKVTRVAYESKTVNNVTIYEVEVTPDRVPNFMRSGMTANIKFIVDKKTGVLLLLAEAIHQEKGRTTVLVPNPMDPRHPLSKEVRIGDSDGKHSELLSGLTEGETVLIPNLAKLRASAPAGSNPFSPMGTRRPQGQGGQATGGQGGGGAAHP
jgi:membrane fusion protein, macrolide-specific efflux system